MYTMYERHKNVKKTQNEKKHLFRRNKMSFPHTEL